LGKNSFANSRTLPSVFGFWAVGEDFFPDSGVFLLGKSFFANSSGLGCWQSSRLLARPQFPVVRFSMSLGEELTLPSVFSGTWQINNCFFIF
jgi:hypothetical protein